MKIARVKKKVWGKTKDLTFLHQTRDKGSKIEHRLHLKVISFQFLTFLFRMSIFGPTVDIKMDRLKQFWTFTLLTVHLLVSPSSCSKFDSSFTLKLPCDDEQIYTLAFSHLIWVTWEREGERAENENYLGHPPDNIHTLQHA